MKKITFILLALISGTAFAQQNKAKGTAEVIATIAQPLTITSEGNLDFATIASPEEAADVVLSPANVRTIPTGLSVPANTTTSVPTITSAKFSITASDYTYSLDITDTDLSATGLTTMELTPKPSISETTTTGDQTLYIGGDLVVGTTQEAGTYGGTVKVTVTYE